MAFHQLSGASKYVEDSGDCKIKSAKMMIPRIKTIKPLKNYKLSVVFDDGVSVLYDVLEDIHTIRDFQVLLSEEGLFKNVQLDESRTCVFWNDRVDIASDTILEYGKKQ